MSKAIVSTSEDAVVAEIEIAAPPARVFAALTDAKQLDLWFGSPDCPMKFWKMDPRLGGRYGYATTPGAAVVNGVGKLECEGEITEIDPPRLLVYTWVGDWHIDKQLKTIVRWELTPTSAGTHLRVTHSGLTNEPASRKDYSGGWPGVVEGLKDFAEKLDS